MNVYETGSLAEKLRSNTYPGRGIVLGLTADGTHSVAAYFWAAAKTAATGCS